MNEPKERESANIETKSGGGLLSGEGFKRVAVYAVVLLVAFLLGLVPMWLASREYKRERDAAQTELRLSRLQNALASAAIDSRRGEYEPARQSASEFFTNLNLEIERGNESAYSAAQRQNLSALFANRDDTITLLARGDAASGERLAEIYAAFRQAGGGSPAPSLTP